jgi:hypothetical protein
MRFNSSLDSAAHAVGHVALDPLVVDLARWVLGAVRGSHQQTVPSGSSRWPWGISVVM